MNAVKWHNNWKEGRNRDPVEAGAQEHGGGTALLCQGSCLSRQSWKQSFDAMTWMQWPQKWLWPISTILPFHVVEAAQSSLHREQAFPFLWGMQRKGTISSSKGLSCIINSKFPGTVQWGRNRWEKQNRLSAEFLGIAISQSPVFQLFLTYPSPAPGRGPWRGPGEVLGNQATNSKRLLRFIS